MLAPTGRAAKVMARYSGMPAYTIHKRLYRGNSTDPCNTSFYLAPNRDKDTIFIVDEASMIPGSATSRLLDHLVRHVYSSPGCAIIFVGDTAQLPPVGESESEAMSPGRLEQYGLRPYCFELDEPLRQAARSGILYNATRIRRRMTRSPLPLPQLWQKGFADVKVSTSEYLSEQIADSYRHTGQEHTIVITRSNWRAGIINRAIRGTVLYAESCLQRGERLVVARNNYFWTTKVKGAQFIANGESAVVQRIVSREERYGHRWADVELLLPDTKVELTAKLLLTTLETDTPTLGGDELNRLYQAVLKEKKSRRHQWRERTESATYRPVSQCLASKIRILPDLPQSPGRTMGACLCRSWRHTTRGPSHTRFLPLAIYCANKGVRQTFPHKPGY